MRLGWGLLGSRPGRIGLRLLCALMVARFQREHGPPALESARAIVRLWRFDRYRSVALRPDEPWVLDDGTLLAGEDPVFEMHVRGDRLLEALAGGAHWKAIMAEEFHSLVPLLVDRDEVAIVGSTILRRQASAFGASLRDAPPGLHTTFDTFYRKLILMAFHRGGRRRVIGERQALADAAISCREFRTRFASAPVNLSDLAQG